MRSFPPMIAIALLTLAAQLPAQTAPQSTAAGPPLRVLGAATARTEEPVLSLTQARGISKGLVLINDGTARRLLLFDSTMNLIKIIADSAPGVANAYGTTAGRLVPYVADSSYLIDGASYSMLVVDEFGDIVTVKAIPRADHALELSAPAVARGIPGFDMRGRLVYRLPDEVRYVSLTTNGGIWIPEQPDSAPLLRMDLKLRKLDTVAKLKMQKTMTQVTRTASGMLTSEEVTNPMPVVDDWGVMSDGSVAVVRGRDFHVDFIKMDGTVESGPPMPFPWQRLTDSHKKAFVDSLREVLEADRYSFIVRYDSVNHACFGIDKPERVVPVRWRPAPPAPPPPTVVPAAGAAPVPAIRPACPSKPLATDEVFQPIVTISPDSLPDYKPPFGNNSVRTDLDNNIWIRVNQMVPRPGAIIYEVVNRKGELIDRLQLPPGRTLIGFGPGGIVFLAVRDAQNARHLERVRWR